MSAWRGINSLCAIHSIRCEAVPAKHNGASSVQRSLELFALRGTMANHVQQVQTVLLHLQSDDNDARKAAERALDSAETNPAFIASVFQIACAPDAAEAGTGDEPALREIAGVIFCRVVRRHWVRGPDDPEVFPDATKERVRAGVLQTALSATNAKMRTRLAVIVGHIAQADWPDRWPALFPMLFRAMGGGDLQQGPGAAFSQPSQTTEAALLSSLRCLAIISEDICDETLYRIMPLTMPRLLGVAATAGALLAARKDAVHIAASFLRGLATLLRHDAAGVKAALGASALPGWMQFSFQVLRVPVAAATHGLKRRVLALHDALLAGCVRGCACAWGAWVGVRHRFAVLLSSVSASVERARPPAPLPPPPHAALTSVVRRRVCPFVRSWLFLLPAATAASSPRPTSRTS